MTCPKEFEYCCQQAELNLPSPKSCMGIHWNGPADPVFRAGVVEADNAYQAASGKSLLPKMFKESPEESDMQRNGVAQPANFLIQIGLLRVLQKRTDTPHSIIGHSVGEVAAAVAAGCLSVKDAALVVYAPASM
mmetsp:Transcript_12204/g.33872  ORF Transcript_12204/g.33872 Transcript_12204/m.33872 type:complete len:134 (+) Transcript_12204:996-1397(+)